MTIQEKEIEKMDETHFTFDAKNLEEMSKILSKYPQEKSRSALIPLLELAQKQNSYISKSVIQYLAGLLKLPTISIYEVASFYSMFNLKPVGKNVIRVCRTLPCKLRGACRILDALKQNLGINLGETSSDGFFTLQPFECLGACVNAPVVMINDEYYEDLEPYNVKQIIEKIRSGVVPKNGSQKGRTSSEPIS